MFSTVDLIADAALVGLIWTVQLAVYPSFRWVDRERFGLWHAEYMQRITWIVLPLMVLQLGCKGWAIVAGGGRAWLELSLVAAVWGCTFVLSVPLHRRLQEGGWRLDLVDRLIATNWPRTLIWSLLLLV